MLDKPSEKKQLDEGGPNLFTLWLALDDQESTAQHRDEWGPIKDLGPIGLEFALIA